MKIINGYQNASRYIRNGCSVVIGDFDGVHLGHQKLLKKTTEQARQLNVPSVVMVFEPQPLEYFMKEKAPVRLMSLRDKVFCLKENEVDYLIVQRFDSEFASISADNFVKDILIDDLGLRSITVGHDFRFGANRLGDITLLKGYATSFGILVNEVSAISANEETISSTRVRKELFLGNLNVQHLLGRSYSLWTKIALDDSRKYRVLLSKVMSRFPLPVGEYPVILKGNEGSYAGIYCYSSKDESHSILIEEGTKQLERSYYKIIF